VLANALRVPKLFTAGGRRAPAVLFALRSGKFREMLYSVFLELGYWWCYVFRTSRLIQFKSDPFWRCCSEYPLKLADLAATLRLCNFSVVESATKWFIVTQSADGMIFGATHDRPHALQRADNLSSAPTELFEFNKPIFCVFLSSSKRIFVATKGVVYLSKNGGSHFDPVLQLSDRDSVVWHNHGIDETPQGIIIGEYGSIIDSSRTWNIWKSVAYIYITHDDGASWRREDYLVRNGNTAFAETDNVTLLGTDYRIAPNSIIRVRSPEDSSARMLPRPYKHSPVMDMLSIPYRVGAITFALLGGGLCPRCQNAVIYSYDDGDSWYRLIEFDTYVCFSFANAKQGANPSLVLSFCNWKLGEARTFIVSPGAFSAGGDGGRRSPELPATLTGRLRPSGNIVSRMARDSLRWLPVLSVMKRS
jgi:hypothetical protein